MARATTDSYGHTLSTQFPAKLRVTTERAGQLTQYAPRDSVGRKRADHIRAWRNDFAARAGRGAQVHTRARERRGAHACARARTPVRMRPCARARTRAPSFFSPSRTTLHLSCLSKFPASASSFPPYPTPPRIARSRPRASLLHCAGLQGSEPELLTTTIPHVLCARNTATSHAIWMSAPDHEWQSLSVNAACLPNRRSLPNAADGTTA
jgi:hypothetical protein